MSGNNGALPKCDTAPQPRRSTGVMMLKVALTACFILASNFAMSTLAVVLFAPETTETTGAPPPSAAPAIAGVSQTTTKAKIFLAYDLWSPYIYIDEATQEQTGFGIEFVKLMQASDAPACSALDITMVQDQWGRMWHDLEDDVKLGDGVNFGLYHAGMTYTHLKGVRPRMGDFSYAITQPASQAVGLLVKLDAAGKPLVDPYSDLAGETIVDVTGYAPTIDTLDVVQNWCTEGGPTYFAAGSVSWVIPEEEGNRAAMAAFKGSAAAKLMYVYADQAEDCLGTGFAGDCEGWEGFGTEYAYLHIGMAAAVNGTTIAFGKKNTGLHALLNPCIQATMETAAYHDLCVAPLRPPTQMGTNLAVCYPNAHWTAAELAAAQKGTYSYNHGEYAGHASPPADYQCSAGYCACSERKAA